LARVTAVISVGRGAPGDVAGDFFTGIQLLSPLCCCLGISGLSCASSADLTVVAKEEE
jgi:hypothetical protein